ncbi:MAG TPA: HAD-IIA family hydrolase, partial [Ignavibacteriaceae bacterium]|nr:HAD-IIA family hydrolase [Ignavibacteriaceae bacterium]
MPQKHPSVLIDFDGVLKIGDKPAPDAEEFLRFLDYYKVPALILSNSSLKTGKEIIEFIKTNLTETNITAITAVDAAYDFVKKNYKRVSVYCNDSVKEVFHDLINEQNPQAVIIGDLGDRWNYRVMNEIFLKVFNGSDLIAMHKNKFWKPDGKNLSLDAGAFISAIEYSSSRKALLIGKPSEFYFKAALDKVGIKKGEEFFMIGDDIENDIYPVVEIGGKGILVYTGKTKFPLESKFKKPDFEAANL